MARPLPSEDYIRSAIYRCEDCTAGKEVFLYHESNDDYRYFDPNNESAEKGVERYEEENGTPECPGCGGDNMFAEKY